MAFIVPENRRVVQPGQVVGKRTVLGIPFWMLGYQHCVCLCECGRIEVVQAHNLKRGLSGTCLMCRKRFVRHGDAGCRLYTIWQAMKRRCYLKSCKDYPRYGGRGITVCDEWLRYEPFREWALSRGFGDKLQIDRIDYDLGYFPDNCRWVTAVTQANNTSRNHYLTAFGETKSLSDWSRDDRCSVAPRTIRGRISKLKWSTEDAITKPKQG